MSHVSHEFKYINDKQVKQFKKEGYVKLSYKLEIDYQNGFEKSCKEEDDLIIENLVDYNHVFNFDEHELPERWPPNDNNQPEDVHIQID